MLFRSRVSVEGGGKTPNILMADAPDLEAAATAAAWGIFFNRGEVCNAGSRLLVEDKVKDEVLDRIMKVAKSMRVGDPLDPATQMGAMVDGTQMERVLGYIEKGRSEGAKVALGGQRILSEKIGRAHVCTPVTNAHLVCRFLPEKKNTN